MDPVQTDAEWWLMSPMNQMNSLSLAFRYVAEKTQALVARAATCALTILAYGCRRYDNFIDAIVRSTAPLDSEWKLSSDLGMSYAELANTANTTVAFKVFQVFKGWTQASPDTMRGYLRQ